MDIVSKCHSFLEHRQMWIKINIPTSQSQDPDFIFDLSSELCYGIVWWSSKIITCYLVSLNGSVDLRAYWETFTGVNTVVQCTQRRSGNAWWESDNISPSYSMHSGLDEDSVGKDICNITGHNYPCKQKNNQ